MVDYRALPRRLRHRDGRRAAQRRMRLRGDSIRDRSDLRCRLLPLQPMPPEQWCASGRIRTGGRRCVPSDERVALGVQNVRFRTQPFLRKVRRGPVRRILGSSPSARKERPIFFRAGRKSGRAGKSEPANSSVRGKQAPVVRHNRPAPARQRQHPSASRQTRRETFRRRLASRTPLHKCSEGQQLRQPGVPTGCAGHQHRVRGPAHARFFSVLAKLICWSATTARNPQRRGGRVVEGTRLLIWRTG